MPHLIENIEHSISETPEKELILYTGKGHTSVVTNATGKIDSFKVIVLPL